MVLFLNQMRRKTSKYSLYDSIGYLTHQASGSIRKGISRELARRGYPIKAEQFSTLVYLWDQEGQSQRELGEKLYRDKTTVTRLVATLESMGFVKRVAGSDDAREKRIFLTEKGQKLMAGATQAVQDVLNLAQNGIEPRAMAICKDVLRRLRQNLA